MIYAGGEYRDFRYHCVIDDIRNCQREKENECLRGYAGVREANPSYMSEEEPAILWFDYGMCFVYAEYYSEVLGLTSSEVMADCEYDIHSFEPTDNNGSMEGLVRYKGEEIYVYIGAYSNEQEPIVKSIEEWYMGVRMGETYNPVLPASYQPYPCEIPEDGDGVYRVKMRMYKDVEFDFVGSARPDDALAKALEHIDKSGTEYDGVLTFQVDNASLPVVHDDALDFPDLFISF